MCYFKLEAHTYVRSLNDLTLLLFSYKNTTVAFNLNIVSSYKCSCKFKYEYALCFKIVKNTYHDRNAKM